MHDKLSLDLIKLKFPKLKEMLEKRRWYPMSYMMIPSVLETADRYIDFLKTIETEEAKSLREEIIFLRMNFRRDS